jgi:hypothetical protein
MSKRVRLTCDAEECALIKAAQAKLEHKRAALSARVPAPSRVAFPVPQPSGVAVASVESAKPTPERTGRLRDWETERPSRSSTSGSHRTSRSRGAGTLVEVATREPSLVEVARDVIEEMAAGERPAYQVAFWLARAFKARGACPDGRQLRAASAAALVHTDEHPLCDGDVTAFLDAEELAFQVESLWPRIRSTATILELAARGVPESAPRFARFLAIAWDLQKLVGEADIYLPQRRLADLLGCAQRQVSSYVAVACARGWLECVNPTYAPGRRAKTYRVTSACPRPTGAS